MSNEHLVAEIRDLFEELAHLSGALAAWDGGSPSHADLEAGVASAEDRVAAIEQALRS